MTKRSFTNPAQATLHLAQLSRMPYLRFVTLDHFKLATCEYCGRKTA